MKSIKLLKLVRNFSKVAGHKVNVKSQLYFHILAMNNQKLKFFFKLKFKRQIPLTIASNI